MDAFDLCACEEIPLRLRDVPLLLAKAVVFGAVTGPFWGAFFTAFYDPAAALRIFVNINTLFWSSVVGVIFSLCFFIACGLGNGYLRMVVKDYPPAIIRVLFFVYNTMAASLACAVSFEIVKSLPTGAHIEVPFFWQVVAIDGAIAAVLSLVIGAFMRLKLQVQESQTKLREQELAVRELAIAASQAQSRALQSQINPHFFFNTLNTISALIDDDPVAARQMIGRLADLFRYTLGMHECRRGHAGREEVQFVRDYLSIERARFSQAPACGSARRRIA